MAYRTYINGGQIFGNNEYYPEWIEFIKSQGIEVADEDLSYEGEITDFMGALMTIEKIVMRLENEFRDRVVVSDGIIRRNQSLFDFSSMIDELESQDPDEEFGTSLFDKLMKYTTNAYAFMPYALYRACEDKLEKTKLWSTKGHTRCYKVKDGESLTVSAS